MMVRTQTLLEPEQHKILTEIARQENRSLPAVVREMVDQQIANHKQMALAAAAEALLADYLADSELTAFQTLNGVDIHA